MSGDSPNMSMKRWLHSTRRCVPSYSTSPWVMLLSAGSSCCRSAFEPLLRLAVLPVDLPDDQQQGQPIASVEQAGARDHPAGSGRASRRARPRSSVVATTVIGISVATPRRADALLAVDRAGDPHGASAALGYPPTAEQRRGPRISGRSCSRLSDDARSACHRDGTWRSPRPAERDGSEEFFEIGGIDAAAQHAEETAVGARSSDAMTVVHPPVKLLRTDLASTEREGRAGPAAWRNRCGRKYRLPAADTASRGIDQPAVNVEDVDVADIGQRADPRAEQLARLARPTSSAGILPARRSAEMPIWAIRSAATMSESSNCWSKWRASSSTVFSSSRSPLASARSRNSPIGHGGARRRSPATSNTPHRVSQRTGPRRAKAAQPLVAADEHSGCHRGKDLAHFPPPWKDRNTPHKWRKP